MANETGGLTQTVRALGPVRLGVLGLIAIGLIAFFVMIAGRTGTGRQALLYQDLTAQDAGHIISRLEAQKIPFSVDNATSQIMVPEEQVGRLRMTLAGEGLPSGGSLGYEIFDKSETFGMTASREAMNAKRALEGELSRSIQTIEGIRGARVQLVLPARAPFERESVAATASVVLAMRAGGELTPGQVGAIRNLVAASVPGLKPSAVSIVDNRGTALAQPQQEGAAALMSNADDFRRAREAQLERKACEVLGPIVGPESVTCKATVQISMNTSEVESQSFDPDQQVLISSQAQTEDDRSNEGRGMETVTVGNALPDAQQNNAGASQSNRQSSKNNETNNFDYGKTRKVERIEAGRIERQSVSIVVDGKYNKDANGEVVYQPRTEAELASLTNLARAAVGYDEQRGDEVRVENLQFKVGNEPTPQLPEEETILGFGKKDLMGLAETALIGILALLVLLLVIRPILTRVLASIPQPAPAALGVGDDGLRLGGDAFAGGSMQALPGATMGGMGGALPAGEVAAGVDDLDRMIDLQQVEGRVRASSLRKISDIVDKHPNETVAILRGWMYQEN